jgi:hypothetical protein
MKTLAPLLPALLIVLVASACQRQQDDLMAEPADDRAATPPMEPVETVPATPAQDAIDPCAGLMGTELDDCRMRQAEPPPVMDPPQPVPMESQDQPPTPTDP